MLPITSPLTVVKPRTVCCQERENDEDMIGSDMTLLTTKRFKVNQLYFMFRFDTFEQLLLHRDLCVFSFSELLTWIKESLGCKWRTWRTKEVDWGPGQVILMFPIRPPRHFWSKRRKSPSPTRFGVGFGLHHTSNL